MTKRDDPYCELCPKKLGVDCPSPAALERIHEIQYASVVNSKEEPELGCDWYINSAEHNYCFWNYLSTIDSPVPDKDICFLLNISQNQLREVCSGAIKKLRENIENPEVANFIEIMFSKLRRAGETEVNQYVESTSETEEKPKSATDETEEQMESILSKFKKNKKRRRTRHGMPLHRDGKKVDLFGLYSNKKDKQ